ncbi:unnamed protein product [Rotaria socialis]|uniref:Uncharacterized protein n=1 Tax=Rotaria socialis TaxID=392032 RepID=A0A821GSF0_9BILA|nr:unnamed protein product [Rotaria socialis]CAF3363911.1 unnamed protein product [Rotaria socialis]CAF3439686.1 unnamed protein product [Rotaria socialis]CAF3472812.1 unnamed protein product [Rotaria socialis]CAF3702436.1 unnamed protein product [Rotaria socialis]
MSSTVPSVPTNKLLIRERPNSATVPSDQEEKRDFVEQLNELSLKQHHRQYSGLHRLNAFHSRSSSVEPQQQQTNVTVINDCENVSEISKEEEILERSRQMLEESKVKNEQLAEQAKVFQRTLQRNEIYSALNRFSNRPPIYPTVVKETRTSTSTSNRFQQLKVNPTVSFINDQQNRIKSANSSQD